MYKKQNQKSMSSDDEEDIVHRPQKNEKKWEGATIGFIVLLFFSLVILLMGIFSLTASVGNNTDTNDHTTLVLPNRTVFGPGQGLIPSIINGKYSWVSIPRTRTLLNTLDFPSTCILGNAEMAVLVGNDSETGEASLMFATLEPSSSSQITGISPPLALDAYGLDPTAEVVIAALPSNDRYFLMLGQAAVGMGGLAVMCEVDLVAPFAAPTMVGSLVVGDPSAGYSNLVLRAGHFSDSFAIAASPGASTESFIQRVVWSETSLEKSGFIYMPESNITQRDLDFLLGANVDTAVVVHYREEDLNETYTVSYSLPLSPSPPSIYAAPLKLGTNDEYPRVVAIPGTPRVLFTVVSRVDGIVQYQVAQLTSDDPTVTLLVNSGASYAPLLLTGTTSMFSAAEPMLVGTEQTVAIMLAAGPTGSTQLYEMDVSDNAFPTRRLLAPLAMPTAQDGTIAFARLPDPWRFLWVQSDSYSQLSTAVVVDTSMAAQLTTISTARWTGETDGTISSRQRLLVALVPEEDNEATALQTAGVIDASGLLGSIRLSGTNSVSFAAFS
jgi:hypothetical protein